MSKADVDSDRGMRYHRSQVVYALATLEKGLDHIYLTLKC